MIDAKRLATDAAYWDECGAPEDAKYYSPDSEDYFEGWLRPCPDGKNNGMQFKHINGDKWINNSCVDKDCIPRPKAPEAEWVDGLPPVGCECECFPDGGSRERCEIVAYDDRNVCIRWHDGRLDILTLGHWKFRPIRTPSSGKGRSWQA